MQCTFAVVKDEWMDKLQATSICQRSITIPLQPNPLVFTELKTVDIDKWHHYTDTHATHARAVGPGITDRLDVWMDEAVEDYVQHTWPLLFISFPSFARILRHRTGESNKIQAK